MLKISSINKNDFDKFINDHPINSHYMQTSAWGEFDKVTNNTTPHYIGFIDENNNMISACLLIEEHLPMNNCVLYAPRGLALNYNDKDLLTKVIYKLKGYAKKKKAIAIKINPILVYKTKVNEDIIINEETENIITTLKTLNFRRKPNQRLLNYNYKVDLTVSNKELENSYSSKIKESLKKSQYYDLEITTGTVKDLPKLFTLLDNKNNNYYETLYDIFSNNEYTKIKLFIGKLNITKTLKNLERELKRINNQISIIPIDHLDIDSKEKLNNLREQKMSITIDLEKFKEYKLEYGNYLIINASIQMEHNNTVWTICKKNDKLTKELNLEYSIITELIKYYKNNNFTSLNEIDEYYKTDDEVVGTYTEYIGEYDLIINPFMYFINKRIIPIINRITKNKPLSK